MIAAPITAVCIHCKRAYVSIGPRRACVRDYGGCGGPVVDLPEPLPNDDCHVVNKYFLRDEFMPTLGAESEEREI